MLEPPIEPPTDQLILKLILEPCIFFRNWEGQPMWCICKWKTCEPDYCKDYTPPTTITEIRHIDDEPLPDE